MLLNWEFPVSYGWHHNDKPGYTEPEFIYPVVKAGQWLHQLSFHSLHAPVNRILLHVQYVFLVQSFPSTKKEVFTKNILHHMLVA